MPVLGTKLHVPATRRELVPRTRLTERLLDRAASQPRLVLVAAPAGFGKTTLMVQWFAAGDAGTPAGSTFRRAWLSLDRGDTEPRRFLSHLVAAVQAAAPSVGDEAAGLLGAERQAATDDVLVSLVNDLETLADALVIALDDYHVIDAPEIHRAVTFLLDNLPPQVILAMATRADPPLPLARLRARGELVEIRAADLRFTEAEAASFLNDVMGLHLGAEDVATLEARTEGWAVGLQLAGLATRNLAHTGDEPKAAAEAASVAAFIQQFAGSHRFVLDYLVEEVLERQSEERRAFLLDTSVLDSLSGSLCDTLTGRGDGRQTLLDLERANLFVVPLDDQRQWYRYHHLFADALRARLAASDPDRMTELQRSAASWFGGRGWWEDAIRYAVAGGDGHQVADLVELALPQLRQSRETELLAEALRAVPTDVLHDRPFLATHFAWVRLAEGDVDGAHKWLDVAQHLLDDGVGLVGVGSTAPAAELLRAREQEFGALPGQIAVYRAAVAQARGDTAEIKVQASRALELARPEDHLARSGGAGFLGLAAWADGDLSTAVEMFDQTARHLRAAGNIADELGTTVVLGELRLGQGRPDAARRLFERALQAADRVEGVALPSTADLHVGLADVLREQGDLDSAANHLRRAKELGGGASLVENRYRWYTAMAGLRRADGDLEGAVQMLTEAEPLFLPGFFPDVRPIPAFVARVRIDQGALAEAGEWVQRYDVAVSGDVTYLSEYSHLTVARLRVAEHREGSGPGELDDVMRLLERIIAAAAAADRAGSLVEAHLVRALALQAVGRDDQAVDDLVRALDLGVPVGYQRLFLDEGEPMIRLLQRAAARTDGAAGLAGDLLRAAASMEAPGDGSERPPVPMNGRVTDRFDEQLSDRELDVLRLLDSDLTGPEIAERLFVSVNTLRTHTKHVFTKLGVNTRRAAVRRATDLGLL